MAIEIERHDDPQGPRIVVRGEIDMSTGDEFEAAILAAEAGQPGAVTLDLSAVEFFDSTGLQILLDANVRARDADRRLVVAPGEGEVMRVLDLAQVADRLDIAVAE